jgi:ribosomal protein S18 acetylase RimI-like enzyme
MSISERVVLPLEVTIRECARDDLPGLEWWGMFSHHREIIEDAFARQERGENLMLIAFANGSPVGQAWIELAVRADEGAGLLWAVRVHPVLQGLGLGARLLEAAERALRERGFAWAEIGVEKDNPRARALYERVGYRLHRELREEYGYTPPGGQPVRHVIDQWMLRKDLRAGAEAETSTTSVDAEEAG